MIVIAAMSSFAPKSKVVHAVDDLLRERRCIHVGGLQFAEGH